MSELALLLAAVSETLKPSDTGAGAPPRIPGHEADRLASLGAVRPERGIRAPRRAPTRAGLWRRIGARPVAAAPPS